jgi:hypothetical protein
MRGAPQRTDPYGRLVATTVGVLSALLALPASAQATLSLSVRVIEQPAVGLPRHVFSGRIGGWPPKGELVTVLAKPRLRLPRRVERLDDPETTGKGVPGAGREPHRLFRLAVFA